MIRVGKPESRQRAWRGLWVMGGLAVIVAGVFGTERGARGAEREISELGGDVKAVDVVDKNGQEGKHAEGKGLTDRALWGCLPRLRTRHLCGRIVSPVMVLGASSVWRHPIPIALSAESVMLLTCHGSIRVLGCGDLGECLHGGGASRSAYVEDRLVLE